MPDYPPHWINLASAKLGARAVACSDDFFAPMARMLNPEPPVFIDGKYDAHGKWMDGWESRRRRDEGYDWCIVQLARPGRIHAIGLDTTHFTGNFPPAASVQGCNIATEVPDDATQWRELVAKTPLQGDRQHDFAVAVAGPDPDLDIYSHVRLNIFPDGGVARLSIYAEPTVDWAARASNEEIDLAAALNGGVALACNNEHFGSIWNLLAPGRGVNMGDGWETRRRREPGHDWVVLALARAGTAHRIEIDTAYFKGNYPDSCDIHATHLATAPDLADLAVMSAAWPQLLPRTKLRADAEHTFAETLLPLGAITHLRVNIHPDGGLSRVRVFAVPAEIGPMTEW